jgi:hypothetical protein
MPCSTLRKIAPWIERDVLCYSTRDDLVQAFQDYQGNVYQVVRPPPWRMR